MAMHRVFLMVPCELWLERWKENQVISTQCVDTVETNNPSRDTDLNRHWGTWPSSTLYSRKSVNSHPNTSHFKFISARRSKVLIPYSTVLCGPVKYYIITSLWLVWKYLSKMWLLHSPPPVDNFTDLPLTFLSSLAESQPVPPFRHLSQPVTRKTRTLYLQHKWDVCCVRPAQRWHCKQMAYLPQKRNALMKCTWEKASRFPVLVF